MVDDQGIRSMLQTLVSPVDEDAAWEALQSRLRRDERQRRVQRFTVAVVAGAAAVVVAVVLAGLPDGSERDADTVPPQATPEQLPELTGERWTRFPSPISLVPFSGDPVVVNTQDGLLVWGRTAQVHIDRTGNTVPLPDAPIVARDDAGGAWTGSELIVWGGQGEHDGAAYDLASNHWREIAVAPLRQGVPIATVWTGAEVLVWGGLPGGGGEGAAYNPATERWRPIASAPIGLSRGNAVLTAPDSLIVLGSATAQAGPALSSSAQAMQYDISADAWTVLPEPDLSPNATWMVWTGSEVIAWDYLLEARSYNPGDGEWNTLPDLPLDGRECYPGGGWHPTIGVLVTYCDQIALLDVDSREWTQEQMPFDVDVDGGERELFGPVVATDDQGLLLLTSEGVLVFR